MDSQLTDEIPKSEISKDPPVSGFSKHWRGSVWLAWVAILGTIGYALFPHSFAGHDEASDPSIILFEIQAKYLVGASSFSVTAEENRRDQIEQVFGNGPLRQQLIGTILISELVGPTAAAVSLEGLEKRIENETLKASDRDHELVRLYRKILDERNGNAAVENALADVDRTEIQSVFPERLGWAGRLALLPAGTADVVGREKLIGQARRALFVILGVFILAIAATTCGIVLQIVWWVFVLTGRVKSGMTEIRGNGVIYAETFAVWLGLFLTLSVVISRSPLPKLGLVVVLIPQIGGLAALAWPVIRGLRFRDVCDDVGLRWGPQRWASPLIGFAAYLSALPILGVAMIVTLAMMAVAHQFAGSGDAAATPVHPIVEPILRGNWSVRLQLLFVAVFAAVPEEIMFRGFLYRHLRESKTRFGYLGGVTFAALISSLIFAVIHPQGLFGIPILMSLAMVFAITREWRGSLVPCMIAHALVNAGTSGVLFMIAD